LRIVQEDSFDALAESLSKPKYMPWTNKWRDMKEGLFLKWNGVGNFIFKLRRRHYVNEKTGS